MKSRIFRNAELDNEILIQLTRLLIPHMVVAIPFKISNIHWPVCGYSQYIGSRAIFVFSSKWAKIGGQKDG